MPCSVAFERQTTPRSSSTQFADFVGIGVHCAQGSGLCSSANGGQPDILGDEPGGYNGFNGLFGAKYVDPQVFPGGVPRDLNGNVIQDASGHVGFPGFDGMEATVSLSWVAHMQEAGIPVTYAYISDAHDGHGTAGNIHFAYGPGESGYVQQLKDYDAAFAKFFADLAAHGINKSNTLFVFTVDEGDHFVGDAPTPAGCDGVTTPCNYNRVGEINADLRRMIYTQFGDSTPFAVHSDDAPTVYVNGTASQPILDQTDPVVRNLEREMAGLSWLNPYTNSVENNIMVAEADHAGMKTLHMITADPFRTPTFTPFADPNWFFFASGGSTPATCATPAACASIPPRTNQSCAWNHGDIQDEIASTWIGIAGPGVANNGVDTTTWSDHTDLRPTILDLVGLRDDYGHDGRLLTPALDGWAIPAAVKKSGGFEKVAVTYKQLNAPFGTFGMDILTASTHALASNSAGDNTYMTIEDQIRSLTSQRDALAAQMKAALDAATFAGQPITQQHAQAWAGQAQTLFNQAHALAGS